MVADVDLELVPFWWRELALLRHDGAFDVGDDLIGLNLAAAKHETAGSLGDAQAKDEDAAAEQRTDGEGDAPANVWRYAVTAEKVDAGEGTDGCADPEGAVH